MRLRIATAYGLLSLAACSSEAPPKTLLQTDLGDAWPLTVTEIEVFCPQTSIPLLVTPTGYLAITGAGQATGARGIAPDDAIWRDGQDGTKSPLGPLIERALNVCGGE